MFRFSGAATGWRSSEAGWRYWPGSVATSTTPFTARRDELFELTDAVLCTDGPVKTLVELVPAPEHQRRHGAPYDGTNHGGPDIGRLRRAITETPLPRAADGRLVLAVDVSPWLRPDANTSPDRPFCHTCGHGKDEYRPFPLHRSRRGGRPFGVGQGSPKRRLPKT